MKKALFASAVLAALVVAQQPAWSAVSFSNPLTVGGSSLLNVGSNNLTGSGGTRSFSESVSFSLASDFSFLEFTVTDFRRSNGAAVEFSSLSGVGGTLFDVEVSGATLTFTSQGPLSAGDYSFSLSGVTGNGSPINFDVSYTAVASPVPEPETYALMLAGLGVVGWAARRRKSAAVAPSQALPA